MNLNMDGVEEFRIPVSLASAFENLELRLEAQTKRGNYWHKAFAISMFFNVVCITPWIIAFVSAIIEKLFG